MELCILGEKWEIEERTISEDEVLENCDGYCDKTVRLIVIGKKERNCNLSDFEAYRRKVMRHEIIHAFLFESGLHENFTHDMGHDETYVDWFAVQFPKIKKVFDRAGCSE